MTKAAKVFEKLAISTKLIEKAMKASAKAENKAYTSSKTYTKLLKLPMPHKTWMNLSSKADKSLTRASNEARRQVRLSSELLKRI